MNKYIYTVVLLLSLQLSANDKVYQFNVKNIDGEKVSLSKYKGKTLLIVNTASKCGFTKQYKGLESLYLKYKDKGFVVLGFPSNQFGSQEPGTNAEIKNFCEAKFKVTFDMFSKIDVNGEKEDPLYSYLKNEKSGVFWTKDIKWNFTKFLIDSNGKVVERYGSSTKPIELTKDIEKILK